MYKIYKSEKVSLGMPKSLVNKISPSHCDTAKKSTIAKNTDEDYDHDKILDDAHKMYANIIEDANNEAKRIVEESIAAIEEHKKKVMKDAYEQGFNKGYEEARRKKEEVIEEAKRIRDSLDERKKCILKESEQEVIKLVLDISKKIIRDEIKQDKDIIISQIKLALDKCSYKNNVSIKVSSEDYHNVSANRNVIESLVEGISEIEIIEDRFLKKGDCIVETPSGEVDSSIELQLKQLEEAFYFALRNEW